MFRQSKKKQLEGILVHSLVLLLLLILCIGLISGTKGNIGDYDYFPLKKVKAGMKGYGLTVFRGTKPEKFDVEVISIIHKFLPRQDLILVRCIHPLLSHTGIVAGMSGSPVYFQGRLAGAIAYAWKFSKEPVAGVTPAENMIQYFSMPLIENKRKRMKIRFLKGGFMGEGSETWADKHKGDVLPVEGEKLSYPVGYWNYFDFNNMTGLSPLVTPLEGNVFFSPRASRILRQQLSRYFMVPASSSGGFALPSYGGKSGGGSGKKKNLSHIIPGQPVAIQLARGDIDLSASGTITEVRGGKVLGFGHPMFNFGQINVPVSSAYVHHCLASFAFSFKMTEPIEQMGALIIDRQAGILIDTNRVPDIIPLKLTLHDKTRGLREKWNMEILHQRTLTKSIARSAITAAVDKFAPDLKDAVIEGSYEVKIRGHRTLSFVEKVFQKEGTYDLGYSSGLSSSIDILMNNDFENVKIEGINADISIYYSNSFASITGAYLSSDEVKEGEEFDVSVVVKPAGGLSEMVFSTRMRAPHATAGKTLTIKVQSGEDVYPEIATPHSLDDVIENLSKRYPPDSIVITLGLPSQGITVGGRIIRNLPPSVLDTLRPRAGFWGEEPSATLSREIIKTGFFLDGSVKLRLTVKEQD